MSVPTIVLTELARRNNDLATPVLVLGPSLGTSVTAVWAPAVPSLAERYTVIGWDLPGHGRSPRPDAPFTLAELAAGVRAALDAERAAGDLGRGALFAAGVSLGGITTLRLALDAPALFSGIGLVCSGAKIGEPDAWRARAETVRTQGTPTMLAGSAQRWFAPGFLEREPEVSSRLLHSLSDADKDGYAACCDALAEADLVAELPRIPVPVVAIAGEHDGVVTGEDAWIVASGVAAGSAEWVPGAGHLASAERPERVAEILARHFSRAAADSAVADTAVADTAVADSAVSDSYGPGMRVRRQVLGSEHVDRATARSAGAVDEDFQELITRYAWGSIWTRPGLPRTMRSAITLTALIAGGHWEEFELHLHAAVRNGLTVAEIREVIMQSAVYCGVPAANHAFSIARDILAPDSAR